MVLGTGFRDLSNINKNTRILQLMTEWRKLIMEITSCLPSKCLINALFINYVFYHNILSIL